jgi:hypothetical protein
MIFDLTSISNFDLLVTIGTCGDGLLSSLHDFFLKGKVRLSELAL